jgi:peptidyl-tRNA hydrolase, PTH1 family
MSPGPSPNEAPYLIVGLGNPGPRYARTRHNAGFLAVEELARRHGMRFAGGQSHSETAKGMIGGARVILAKPQTFMNESGRAVQGLSHFYKVPREQVIVMYDDFALPLGTLRLREKGSSGGHNGLESIIRHLGSQAFPRVRIGVGGPPGGKGSHIDWVLGRFTAEEQPIIEEAISRATDSVESAIRIGFERTMNEYNTRGEPLPKPAPTPTVAKNEVPPAPPQTPLQAALDRVAPRPAREDSWLERARRIVRGERGSEE